MNEYTVFGFFEDDGRRAGFEVEAEDPDRAEATACAQAASGFQAVAVVEGHTESVENTTGICGAESWREVYPELFEDGEPEADVTVGEVCIACGRASLACSADPCAEVIRDRNS